LDLNYLFLRQQTERSRARAAASEVARTIHEQLASQYERMIEDATGGRVTFVHGDDEASAAIEPRRHAPEGSQQTNASEGPGQA
jgi:hypothetical protein